MSAPSTRRVQSKIARVKFSGPITAAPCQRGMALVMALAILLILTILGVAAMSTTNLQEKMAGNVQEQTRAFEAAESGLNKALTTPGTLVLTSQTQNDFTIGNTNVPATSRVNTHVVVTPRQSVDPKRGSGFSNTEFSEAHFDLQSTATTVTGANATIHRGVKQITRK